MEAVGKGQRPPPLGRETVAVPHILPPPNQHCTPLRTWHMGVGIHGDGDLWGGGLWGWGSMGVRIHRGGDPWG